MSFRESRIILAADGLMLHEVVDLVKKIHPRLFAVKIHDLYDFHGEEAVTKLAMTGVARVWVDFKLHDIPATNAKRAKQLSIRGANILTVHASAGVAGMKAVVDEVGMGTGSCQIFAVTVLTSLTDADIEQIYNCSREEQVRTLAFMAKEAGVHGIVCSPQEVAMLSESAEFRHMELITPGVRSKGKEVHDQKRVGTPKQAIDDGATRLVIGRQIIEAADPLAALKEIEEEINAR